MNVGEICSREVIVMDRGESLREAVALMRENHVGDVVITAVPATHIARSTGFIAQTESSCVYFAGDTFYRSFMAEIGRRFPIDVALLPVTTFRIPISRTRFKDRAVDRFT